MFMFITKKARQGALFDIANSEVLCQLVKTLVHRSTEDEYGWLNATTTHKKDKGVREIVVGRNFVIVRPVLSGYPEQDGLAYNLESSGYGQIGPYRNHKGRIVVNQKKMIALFAEEFASQLVTGEFGLAYKIRGFSDKSDPEAFMIKYSTKVPKK